MSWAARRRSYYLGGVFLALLVLVSIPVVLFFSEEPTCFDGRQNGDERGVDCGGSCRAVCMADAVPLKVLWSRSFRVAPGIYNAVAYVENPNFEAGVERVSYRFTLHDDRNITITERDGTAFIMPGGITPVFEGTIPVGERVPARTTFELGEIGEWVKTRERSVSPLSVTDRRLTRVDTAPRIDATLRNASIEDVEDVEVVSVIYDINDNAIGASQTALPLVERRGSASLVFTWPVPFETEIERCLAPVDAVLAIDVSGSMNDDGLDPPQPLTDAKSAAADFVRRLSKEDRVGVVSFATLAAEQAALSDEHTPARTAILSIAISPEEETGLTNIGAALREARASFQSNTVAGAERDVVVLLTDGRANAPEDPDAPSSVEAGEAYAGKEAVTLKEAGIVLYAIGLGADVNQPFLRTLASSPDTYRQAATSRDLDLIYREISADLCERGPAVIDIIPKVKDIFF